MTVSRVLRDSPKVSPETRARVLKAAKTLRYRPHPQMIRLMAMVRGMKAKRITAALAVVRDCSSDELRAPFHQYVALEGMVARAASHGYNVEEFFLGRNGMTPPRLTKILAARGIEGIIISPQSPRGLAVRLDFSRFAGAVFGYGLRQIPLHRASTNMMQGLLSALEEMTRRGYRRIGLALTPWMDERSDYTSSGALLHYQRGIPRSQRVRPLIFPANDVRRFRDAFCQWVKTCRPDGIIGFDAYLPDWLEKTLGYRIPHDIGFLVHDWEKSMSGLAGICHNRTDVAAVGIDLVANQLLHNERGIPAVPRQTLISATWMEGSSLRPPNAGAMPTRVKITR